MSTLTVWIMLVFLAAVAAIVAGLCHPCISQDTKDKLKWLETERGYEGDIIYRNNPVVEITERYSLKVNCIIVAVFMLTAWTVFVVGGLLTTVSSEIFGECSFWQMFGVAVVSLLAHAIVWIMLSIHSVCISGSRFMTLKKYYKHRRARVEIITSVDIPILNQIHWRQH